MSLKNKIVLLAILFLALALRLWAILNVGDFSWDEMFSFLYSQKPWGEAWHFWIWETNPPLHLAFLKTWFLIFPANEFFARLPSAIFGTLTVFTIYKTGLRFFNEKIALLAGLLLALHPYHIFLSTFGRGYALLILLAAVSFYYFLKIFIQNENSRKNYIILAAVNLAMALTHLTAFIFLLAETAVVLIKNAKKIKEWILLHLAPAALWLAWAIPAFLSKKQNTAFGSAWFLNFDPNPLNIFIPLKLFFLGPGQNFFLYGLMILFLIALIIRLKERGKEFPFLAALAVFALTIFFTLLLTLWNIRFLIFALPAFLILAAVLINDFIEKKAWAIIFTILIAAPGLFYINQACPLFDWGRINNFLSANHDAAKKQIFVYNDFIEKLLADRYYRAPMPAKAYLGGKEKNWDKKIIFGNYLRYPRSDEETRQWYETERLDDFDEIFLLYSPDVGVDLPLLFKKQGWRLKSISLVSPGRDERKIYKYVKN